MINALPVARPRHSQLVFPDYHSFLGIRFQAFFAVANHVAS